MRALRDRPSLLLLPHLEFSDPPFTPIFYDPATLALRLLPKCPKLFPMPVLPTHSSWRQQCPLSSLCSVFPCSWDFSWKVTSSETSEYLNLKYVPAPPSYYFLPRCILVFFSFIGLAKFLITYLRYSIMPVSATTPEPYEGQGTRRFCSLQYTHYTPRNGVHALRKLEEG